MRLYGFVVRVHLPERLRRYGYFDVGREHRYFGERARSARLRRIVKSGFRAAEHLEDLLRRRSGFRFALSLSGPFLEAAGSATPGFLERLRRLLEHPRVEAVGESSHHTLSHLVCPAELNAQVALYVERLTNWCGPVPKVFRNAGLLHSPAVAAILEERGFAAALVSRREGQGAAAMPGPMRLLGAAVADERGVFQAESLDLAALGRSPAVLARFEARIDETLSSRDLVLATPSEALAELAPAERPSCAPVEESPQIPAVDPVAGEPLPADALAALFALRAPVLASGREELLDDFRRLTNADLFAAMGAPLTGASAAGRRDSSYEVYLSFRYAIRDLERRVEQESVARRLPPRVA